MKLSAYRYLLRLWRSKTWSDIKMRNEALKYSHKIYDQLDMEYAEELIITSSHNGVVVLTGRYDEDKENVLALLHIDLLSHTAQIKCNESGDYLGVGRSVKKLLEGLKFKVYYSNVPIALINGVVAHGKEQVMSLQLRAGQIQPNREKRNETIH